MAPRSKTPPPRQPASLDATQMRKGIKLLKRRIANLKEFDPTQINDRSDPRIRQLSNRIDSALVEIFHIDSYEYERYRVAAMFSSGPIVMNRPGGPPGSIYLTYRNPII